MKVSVIVPCYKFSEHIGECLSSILIQKTNFDFEILIRTYLESKGYIVYNSNRNVIALRKI